MVSFTSHMIQRLFSAHLHLALPLVAMSAGGMLGPMASFFMVPVQVVLEDSGFKAMVSGPALGGAMSMPAMSPPPFMSPPPLGSAGFALSAGFAIFGSALPPAAFLSSAGFAVAK